MTDAIGRCDAAPTDGGTDGGADGSTDGASDAATDADSGTDVGGMDAGADAHDASLSDDAGPKPDAMMFCDLPEYCPCAGLGGGFFPESCV
jgi:hypothetical protein